MKIIFDYNRTIFDPEQQELYAGVLELLISLSGKHELFLLSKNEPGRQEFINDLGISNLFKSIIFTDNKSTALFQEIIGLEEIAIVVGDRVRGEISIGNKLNYITVWVRQGKFKDEMPVNDAENPKHTIDNINELKEILKKYE